MRQQVTCLVLVWILAFACWKAEGFMFDEIVDVSNFAVIDTDECYDHMVQADVDNDGFLTGDEYVVLCQLTTGDLDDVSSFEELPRRFQITFTVTACYCSNPIYGGDPEDDQCCVIPNAKIRVPVTGYGRTDELYLTNTCALLDAAAQGLLTPSPTSSPEVSTQQPTHPPTPKPTHAPTTIPTNPPTPQPTHAPTPIPTDPPNPMATDPPTFGPTNFPTQIPDVVPPTSTDPPTTNPTDPVLVPTTSTDPPTTNPTDPVLVPTTSTDPPTTIPIDPDNPTLGPTDANKDPTTSPTRTFGEIASIIYNIAYVDGKNLPDDSPVFTDGLSDLQIAVAELARRVAERLGGRLLVDVRGGRRLAIQTSPQTSIDVLQDDIVCPVDVAEDDLCQEINSKIPVRFTDGSDATDLADFETALLAAVDDGELQSILVANNPETPITILGSKQPPPPDADDDGTLNSAGRAAIVIGALAAIGIFIGIFLVGRQTTENKQDYEEYKDEGAEEEDEPSVIPAQSLQSEDISLYTDGRTPSEVGGDVPPGASSGSNTSLNVGQPPMLGASQPNYGKPPTMKDLEAMEAGEDIVAEPGHVEPDGSSNAGSSGWSSSAGFSSLNTGSMDDSMDQALATGATLAGIGAASRIMGKAQAEEDIADTKPVSRDQLDSLIESGDWAAVGATAALLAHQSDSQSASSRSRTTSRSRDSGSIDAARAAELDQLVDAGDWEGVVLAAAKFQASSESMSGTGSKTPSENRSLATGSSTGTTSGLQALIRKVLPSEDVNEMMNQYRGREAELVETLRRLHIRQGGTSAEFDSMAGSLVVTGTGSGTGTGTIASRSATTSISDTGSRNQRIGEIRAEVEALVRRVVPEEIDNVDEMMNQFKGREEELVETLRTMHERSVAQKARTTNQKAAKAEARQTVQHGVVPGVDGAAQRLAAANSVDPAIALETARRAVSGQSTDGETPAVKVRSALEVAIEAGDWDAVSEAANLMNSVNLTSPGDVEASSAYSSSSRSRRGLDGVNAARAAQLDALIDEGEWEAVCAAATRFINSDKKGITNRMSKEEEDALKQAELWMKIADQKKAEGATDAGASDAAEWAIQRSLNQMEEAERQMAAVQPEVYEEDEV